MALKEIALLALPRTLTHQWTTDIESLGELTRPDMAHKEMVLVALSKTLRSMDNRHSRWQDKLETAYVCFQLIFEQKTFQLGNLDLPQVTGNTDLPRVNLAVAEEDPIFRVERLFSLQK